MDADEQQTAPQLKLFLVHAGFYDRVSESGIFEMHFDFFVAATDFADAKEKAKAHPEFKKRKMHVDGLMAVEAVDGFRVTLDEDPSLEGKTVTAASPETFRALNSR